MRNLKIFILGALVAITVVTRVNADSENTVKNAYGLCSVFDNTGLLSKPCEVSGWSQSVDISIDTTSLEAIKICKGMAKIMAQKNIRFDSGWKIRIYSPFSNENTIATCKLPN